jgi:hypothetical protein
MDPAGAKFVDEAGLRERNQSVHVWTTQRYAGVYEPPDRLRNGIRMDVSIRRSGQRT